MKQLKKRPRGRPPEPVPSRFADEIIEAISNGESLRAWCRVKGRPTFTTVYDWISKDEQFALRFKEARRRGFDAIADECKVIASSQPNDQLDLNWKKLQIDTALRLLGKWDPSRYGDKVGIDHGGGITLNVITGVPDGQ
jgi:hypothetical protein